MEDPPEGRDPPPGTRTKTRKHIGGTRCCPRCMTGGPRGQGGKHYGHDRAAEDCVLHVSTAQGGAARKLLIDAAKNHAWEKGTKGILKPHRARTRRGTRKGTTRPARDRRARRGRRRRTPCREPAGGRAAGYQDLLYYLQKQSSPTTRSRETEHQEEETTNTDIVVFKHKLVELYPRRRKDSSPDTTGYKTTSCKDSDDLLSSEEVVQDLALLDILNYENEQDQGDKKTKRQKGKKKKKGRRATKSPRHRSTHLQPA